MYMYIYVYLPFFFARLAIHVINGTVTKFEFFIFMQTRYTYKASARLRNYQDPLCQQAGLILASSILHTHKKIIYHSASLASHCIRIIYYYFSRVLTPRLPLALAGKHKAIPHRILLRFFNAQQRQLLRRAYVRDVFLEALREDEIDLLERAPARLGVE